MSDSSLLLESVIALPADGLEAAEQIIEEAESRGARLRLLGGLAFKKLCPSANGARYFRESKDIDLMGRREEIRGVMKTMETLGYKPREVFNKLSMGKRLIYYDLGNRRRVDIFLDEFEMCHKFNFKKSLEPNTYTLPLTELIMTKLQVVERTEKEYLDLTAAFRDFDVTDGHGEIEGDRIAEVCSKDWGIYATFTKSLASLKEWAETRGSDDSSPLVPRIDKLVSMIEARPKGLSWKMRARIGEKARWYELPDSDGDAMLA